jgi:hypothetical protein
MGTMILPIAITVPSLDTTVVIGIGGSVAGATVVRTRMATDGTADPIDETGGNAERTPPMGALFWPSSVRQSATSERDCDFAHAQTTALGATKIKWFARL